MARATLDSHRIVTAAALASASGLAISQGEALQRGLQNSVQNTVMDKPLNLQSGDFSFLNHRTVRVSATRTVDMFFAKAFNKDSTEVTATATAEIGNRDIMLLFDRSGSMDDDTVDPNIIQPLTDTRNAALYFVNLVMANNFVLDRVGLVSYSTGASMDLGLGGNFGAIQNRLEGYEAYGWTNIGEAIKKARNHLNSQARTRTSKVMVLLSDGIANRPRSNGRGYALQQARRAASSKIKIFTISLGNRTDINLMRKIASITAAQHFYSPTPAQLDAIFEEIADWTPIALIN